MILLISDLHTRFELVNDQIDHAEARLGRSIEAAILLGDVGFAEPYLSRFFGKGRQRFRRRTYFVEGNHEDFDALPRLVARYEDELTFLPRGWAGDIAGWRCLALGGAAYMDALMTPRGSVVTDEDIERCLAHQPSAVDLVLSHDCPQGIGVASSPGFEHLGPPGLPQGQRLLSHFQPRLWVFGHHHRWLDLARDGTRFLGLPQAWQGYALLAPDGTLEAVPHAIPLPPSLAQRLRRRLATWLRPGGTGAASSVR